MDNTSYITRDEHLEFQKRLDAENDRQNRRIELLEKNVLEIGELTTTVARLAVNLENVIAAQKRHEERLETLEARDGEKWRQITTYIITAIIGIVIGYLFTQVGIGG